MHAGEQGRHRDFGVVVNGQVERSGMGGDGGWGGG